MDIKLQTTLVAGTVSVLVALIGLYFSQRREKEVIKRFEFEQQRELASKLYDRRLDCYSEAFRITEKLDRSKGYSVESILAMQKEAKDQLQDWHGNGAALIMSSRSVKMYYQLLQALVKQPGGDREFTNKQRENILAYRISFRRSLREDIGILHESADNDS